MAASTLNFWYQYCIKVSSRQ